MPRVASLFKNFRTGTEGIREAAAKALRKRKLRHLLAHGLRKLASPLLDYGSVTFFVRRLETDSSGPPSDLQLELRVASLRDLELISVDLGSSRSARTLRERFLSGDLCFIALDGAGRVAHARWVTTRRGYIPELGMDMILGSGEAYFYDGYTRVDLRGQGIDGAVRSFIFNWLRSAGFQRAYSYVRGNNPVGLRAARRWQQPIGTLRYFGLRGLTPFVVGCRKSQMPLRRRDAARDEKERTFRANVLRSWFESWLGKPLPNRSTGYHALPEDYFASTADFIAEVLRLNRESDFVLDVGCDSAMVSRLVSLRSRGFVGIDFVPGLLAFTSHESIRAGSGDAAFFIAADGRFLPFRDRFFTKGYCCGVIHALPSQEDGIRMIDEIVRVCQPGGEVLVASVPDTRKRLRALIDMWRYADLSGRLKLVASLSLPRRVKEILRRFPGLERPDEPVFLEYDLGALKSRMEARGLACQVLDFPDHYWSRDFRRTRSNLLIKIPPGGIGSLAGVTGKPAPASWPAARA